MKLVATEAFFALFPEANIAVVVARGVDNRARETTSTALRSAQEAATERFRSVVFAEHPRIRCWREAYRAFGVKPKDYPSSIENLMRRALKGEPLRSINPLVDL
ncbi:MAG: B3/B4 domain-containing protein, partial [Vicinamibacteria bacterium]